jgi:hypothetical protein
VNEPPYRSRGGTNPERIAVRVVLCVMVVALLILGLRAAWLSFAAPRTDFAEADHSTLSGPERSMGTQSARNPTQAVEIICSQIQHFASKNLGFLGFSALFPPAHNGVAAGLSPAGASDFSTDNCAIYRSPGNGNLKRLRLRFRHALAPLTGGGLTRHERSGRAQKSRSACRSSRLSQHGEHHGVQGAFVQRP